MPYIPQDQRDQVDPSIERILIAVSLSDIPENKKRGACNYIITRILLNVLKPEGGWSYHSISDVQSVLQDAHDEIGRRLMGPREDSAIGTNGDLEEFK